MEELTAKISGIVFSNRATGFYVLRALPDGGGPQITVRGTFPGVVVGVGLKAKFNGRFDVHPTYGKQLNAASCELLPENGRNGIITYLSSHVPSIGPVTAARMYDALGEDLLKILDTESDQIRSLPFLTARQSDAIVKEWSEASELRNSSIFLSNLGLSSSQIRSAYTVYGSKTREIVLADPYVLCSCSGIGFPTADTAARKLGVGVDDPKRVRAIILFALREMGFSDGHMFATSGQIMEFTSRRMFSKHAIEPFSHGEFLSESHFYSSLQSLTTSGDVHVDDTRIYLASSWKHESEAAAKVAKFSRQFPVELGNIESILSEFEARTKVSFSDDQRAAFMLLSDTRVCVITGFPGTGKTTMISAFVNLFETKKLNYSLLSPTGIAAKRLSQVTGKSASTIHRALGFKKDGSWEFHSGNKYVVDAIIVDEMSMVDASTFHHLVTSLPDTTILIMVGDPAQLPSVGAGYVLHNLMGCPDVPHVSLTKIYRQGRTSDIITVAHSILNGSAIDTSFNPDSEFVFLPFPKDQVVGEICKLATALKGRKKNFQVVAPMYDGELGVNNLNQELRDVLNPGCLEKKAPHVKSGETDLYEGDRVMVVKNDYERMIFNGDVGKITKISLKDDEVHVKVFEWFDHESPTPRYIDKVMTFKVEEARNVLKVAYACTTHKVQGQEFDYVLMPMTSQYGIMLYKNLVYTAITRAKTKVFVFGDPNAFLYAVRNNRETTRNSRLRELVHDYADIEATRQVHDP